MEASYHPCGGSQSAHGSEETTEALEMFYDWSDQPCDVTLVVKDGEQFKAHGNVLRQASTFFEKILDGDWKENREGIIRLELLSDEIMEDILRFIYTGCVHVKSVERAIELIAASDYLFLPRNLKDIPGQFLEQTLSTSNCILIYHIAERYRCERLLANTRKFIHLNFASVSKAEDFLKLSGREVEQWISSDEINISAEDDVFRIILKWIDYDKEERKMKFQDLFRHARLGFVSLSCLLNEISTNELVKKDEACLNSILEWMNGSSVCCDLFSRSPRKTLQKEALVVLGENRTTWFYVPIEDKWYQLPDMPFIHFPRRLLSIRNNLFVVGFGADWVEECPCYDPFLNNWTALFLCSKQPLLGLGIEREITAVVALGDEICVIVEDFSAPLYNDAYPYENWYPRTLLYTLDSDSAWKTVPFFDWGPKNGVCVVPADKYLYAIGGYKKLFDDDGKEQEISIREVARFDIRANKWETIASIQRARCSAFGVAVGQKIFIAGGYFLDDDFGIVKRIMSRTCEMYKMSTNEWQFIANLTIPRVRASMVCVDETLYVLGGSVKSQSGAIIERYDKEKNEWKQLTAAPAQLGYQPSILSACSLSILLNSDLHSVLPNMELLISSEVEAMLSDDDSWSLDSSSTTS